jgi:hypothetical protein
MSEEDYDEMEEDDYDRHNDEEYDEWIDDEIMRFNDAFEAFVRERAPDIEAARGTLCEPQAWANLLAETKDFVQEMSDTGSFKSRKSNGLVNNFYAGRPDRCWKMISGMGTAFIKEPKCSNVLPTIVGWAVAETTE